VGPAFYERKDQRLKYPIQKAHMVQYLLENKPDQIGGIQVDELLTTDGVKYLMADDSWLLIRPSGTEPVLRVYAEGRSEEMVQALLDYGEEVAEKVT
jgi:phosphomannomutase